MTTLQYTLNGDTLRYEAEGPTTVGPDLCLLDRDVDLTSDNDWSAQGYTVVPLFPKDIYETFQRQTVDLVLQCWREAGLNIPPGFEPELYHRIVPDQSTHLRAVERTKLLSTGRFPGGIDVIEERISALCGRDLVAKNPFDNQRVFHFRVIRPGQGDNNPLHRDVWLEDYSSCINLYIPVAGSNARSSLILIPGSHRWKESAIERTVAGAVINGQRFNVPAVTHIRVEHEFVRPDPAPNEVLVFSPYLIHGGAVNLNEDMTRISIELRLWAR